MTSAQALASLALLGGCSVLASSCLVSGPMVRPGQQDGVGADDSGGSANQTGSNGSSGKPHSSAGGDDQGTDVGEGGMASSGVGGGGATATGGKTSHDGSSNDNGTSGESGAGTGPVVVEKFSFFVTSLKAMQKASGSADGFGGDLRFGETGAGAGLRGADKICTAIAEESMPGNGKTWRAFLSTNAEDARDRIGNGPWYDRIGRLLALNLAGLLQDRPVADVIIQDDLPNEDGIPNHKPDVAGAPVDNHHVLTGSSATGQLLSNTATCLDWTSKERNPNLTGRPRVGLSWPRVPQQGNWISALDEAGCGAGYNFADTGNPDSKNAIVGSGGGYGGIYCFALTP